MLQRYLDDDQHPEVRARVTGLTVGRLAANSVFRFTPPFLPIIGRGLDTSLETLGRALAVGELTGLTAPALGQAVDRRDRRFSLVLGLAGVALGGLMAAVSPSVALFGLALAFTSAAKITYDVALNAWVADRVHYERRARVMALTETSWAGGMLVGVPVLGLVAALTSWRVAYGTGAAACGVVAVVIAVRLPAAAPVAHDEAGQPVSPSLDGAAYSVIATMALLMGAAQFMFVTFGSWLADRFGFGTAAIGATAVLLGLAELGASIGAVRFTDQVGKRRSVLLGASTMAPAALALALCEQWMVPGIALLALFILGFEFSIVSVFPITSELRPSARARTMGLGLSAGTGARGVASIPATWLYANHGFTPTALVACGLALLILPTLGLGARSVR